ncbi:MAG: class I SAM-dependent methyltransferase [Bacteroidales bacterium]|nr:class I SAM-dependent methyltransferase [Bacteroidales bacterium]
MHIPENTSKNTHNKVAELLFNSEKVVKVLDIPCGYGAFTKRLLDKNIEVYSGDIENILKIENPRFRTTDMNEPLPFDNNFLDSIVCIDGIEHLERQFDFVRECHRTLKPGGSFIISTPNINSLRSRWRWFLTAHHNKCKSPLNEEQSSALHHIALLSFSHLRYMLHRSGFKITEITTNRIKLPNWAYLPWVPIAYIKTLNVFRKEEKDTAQKIRNKEIQNQLFKKEVLFGETLIVKAIKEV